MVDKWPELRQALGIRRPPHYSTLCCAERTPRLGAPGAHQSTRLGTASNGKKEARPGRVTHDRGAYANEEGDGS